MNAPSGEQTSNSISPRTIPVPKPSTETSPAAVRSTFITALGWIFLAGAGMMTFISVLQVLMFVFVFPHGAFRAAANQAQGMNHMPALMQFTLRNIPLLFAAFWALSVLTLVAAIGLLRRHNWARLVFIGLMGFGIAWNLGGIVLQEQILSSIPPSNEEAEADFAVMIRVMRVAMALFALAISLLMAWILKRLLSGAIRAEFRVRQGLS